MRLQSAIPLNQLTDFGALPLIPLAVARAARRGRRRKRANQRKERAADRGRLPRKARREERREREPRERRGGSAFVDALPGLVERVLDHYEPEDDEFDDLDDEMEGLRRRRGVPEHSWSEPIPMGARLRLQARRGHRAAVMELRPGLYLVAEVPEEATRPEMGMAPMLAPMMASAAREALEGVPRGRGPLGALFRRQPGTRVVRVQQAPALPGPVARPMLPGPVEGEVLVPDVGWANDQDIAEAIGCAEHACARCRR